MANILTYQDLSHAEQLEYERLVGQGQYRPFLSLAQSLGAYVSRLFHRPYVTPHSPTGWSTLEQFIRMQAVKRSCDSFDRDSFPNFPAGVEPVVKSSSGEMDKAEPGYPQALHNIIETFRNAAPAQHLELLMTYVGRLPALPEELHRSRDTMEQVDECMTPVFLSAQLRDGKVYYHIDVPSDAPTMRGFAGLLYVGLNGATPAAIAATPGDLCQQLGLHKALGSLRSRGFTALLRRMQRNAVDLATA